MHHPIDRLTHTTAFVTPVVEHWLEWEGSFRHHVFCVAETNADSDCAIWTMDGQLRYPTLVPYEDPSDWEVADPGTTDKQATLELSVGFVSWTGRISEVLAGEELAVGRCQHRDLHRLWPRLMSLELVCPNPEANYWISLQCLESTSSGMLLEHLWWCIHSIDWCEDICHPRDVSNLNVDLKTVYQIEQLGRYLQ